MRPKLRIRIRRIRIRIPRTRQDGTALNPRLQSLFSQRQPLQLFQSISIRCAIKHCILQQLLPRSWVKHGTLDTSSTVVLCILEFPSIATFVVE